MRGSYFLVGKTPFLAQTEEERQLGWAQDRRVDLTQVGNRSVSTVFLPIDHGWESGGLPYLFETMVFSDSDGDPWTDYQDRWRSWDEAQVGHNRVVARLRNGEGRP